MHPPPIYTKYDVPAQYVLISGNHLSVKATNVPVFSGTVLLLRLYILFPLLSLAHCSSSSRLRSDALSTSCPGNSAPCSGNEVCSSLVAERVRCVDPALRARFTHSRKPTEPSNTPISAQELVPRTLIRTQIPCGQQRREQKVEPRVRSVSVACCTLPHM